MDVGLFIAFGAAVFLSYFAGYATGHRAGLRLGLINERLRKASGGTT